MCTDNPEAYENEYDSFSKVMPRLKYQILSLLCLENQVLVEMDRIWGRYSTETFLLKTLQNYD